VTVPRNFNPAGSECRSCNTAMKEIKNTHLSTSFHVKLNMFSFLQERKRPPSPETEVSMRTNAPGIDSEDYPAQ